MVKKLSIHFIKLKGNQIGCLFYYVFFALTYNYDFTASNSIN
ncbi:protein of unknown function [Tenacibaculum soleae]